MANTGNEPAKLDLKDKKILYLLDFNARMPYAQLAKEVGLSKQGAEYKVQNLIRKGVIKGFYPVINVPKLGYRYCRLSLVLQNVTPEKEQEILAYLVNDSRIFWVFTTQGMFDILTAMWVPSLTAFQEAITDLLAKYGKYIKAKNESIPTDVIHYQLRYLFRQKETAEIHLREPATPVPLDDLDKNILKLLCVDARIPLVTMAAKLNASSKTIAYRLKNLERMKIIEGYRPIIDHRKLGYTYYKLWINIHYEDIAQIRKLYAYIRENPIVLYIVKGIGMPEDLDVEIMVQNSEELYTFVKDLKIKFPQLIGDYKMFMFVDTKKVRYLPF